MESVEERLAATVGMAAAAFAAHGHAVAHPQLVHPLQNRGQHPLRHGQGPLRVVNPMPTTTVDGSGTFHFRLPSNFQDWGVVTLWNNTNVQVTFGVSASTFQNGLFHTFTLNSGQRQSFFAPVVSGRAPQFQVSFNPDNSKPIPLSNVNIVFESSSFVPQSTAGWPYAINLGLNTFSISQI